MSSDYQKLTVWTRSKDLAVAVYRVVEGSTLGKDFGLLLVSSGETSAKLP